MSPSASQELVQGRIQPQDEDLSSELNIPSPPPPFFKNVFSKVFQKKKNKWFLVLMFVGLVGYQVSWLEMMPRHASNKRQTVLVSHSALQELVQGRNPASRREPIKRIEHPSPPPHFPKNIFPKFFQKKKNWFLVLMFGWLGGSNVPSMYPSPKNASPKNNSMYDFDVRLAWWVIKSHGWGWCLGMLLANGGQC